MIKQNTKSKKSAVVCGYQTYRFRKLRFHNIKCSKIGHSFLDRLYKLYSRASFFIARRKTWTANLFFVCVKIQDCRNARI